MPPTIWICHDFNCHINKRGKSKTYRKGSRSHPIFALVIYSLKGLNAQRHHGQKQFQDMYTCGTTRNLQCHPFTCVHGPCFLATCNVHVTCRNTHGTKFTSVDQKIHTHTFTHAKYSLDTTRSALNIASNLPN